LVRIWKPLQMPSAWPPGHHVVAIRKAAREDGEIGVGEVGAFEDREGDGFGGEADGFERTRCLPVSIGSWKFKENRLGHEGISGGSFRW